MADDHLLDGVLAHGAAWAGLVVTLAAGALAPGPSRRSLLGVGGALLVGGAGLLVTNATLAFTGELGPAQAADVLAGTTHGRTIVVWAAAAALGWGGAALDRRRLALVGLATTATALVGLGHGATRGALAPLALLHLVHAGAVSVWMAGLLALSTRLTEGERPRDALARFSSRAAGLVAVVLASGGLLTARYGAAIRGPWVGALALKLVLVGVVLGLALRNRRRLGGLDAPDAWAALDRGVFAELAAAAGVGALASLLSQLEPP